MNTSTSNTSTPGRWSGSALPGGDRGRLVLRRPDDVLAKVPFLVGFHPWESLVALALGPDRDVIFTLRADLPVRDDQTAAVQRTPSGRDALLAYAHDFVDPIRARGGEFVLVVAYAPGPREAGPALTAVEAACAEADLDVLDLLVANGQRWWSFLCPDPLCCPPDGTPYELGEHPVTAHSVFAGEVALADEDAMRRSLAPFDTAALPQLLAVVERVRDDVERQLAAAPDRAAASVAIANDQLVPLIRSFASGDGTLTDEEVARAAVLVSDLQVRDEIWSCMSRTSVRTDIAFWSEVLRRTLAPYDVAPATLLAFAAWLDGGGALARCALERAFASDPYYSMAHLVMQLLAGAVPPEAWSTVGEHA